MKRMLQVWLLVVLVVCVAGCAGQPKAKKFKIGLMPANLYTDYYIIYADTVKEEVAKNPNLEVEVLAPSAATAVDESMKIIEDFTEKQVDLLVLATSSWDALAPTLKKAQEAGIPVVFQDRILPLEGVEPLAKLGTDEVAGGRLVGEFVSETLNGKGKVAVMTGVSGSYHAEKRSEGFNSVIKDYPEIEVVSIQAANWARELGMATAENILQANADLDLIWGQNDAMALGAYTAVESAGRQDQVKVVGYTGFNEAMQSVKDGKLAATFLLQPKEYAKVVVNEIAPALMAGKKGEIQAEYNIPVVAVTPDTVDKYLD